MSRLANSTRLHHDLRTLHAERATEDGYVTATLDLTRGIRNENGQLIAETYTGVGRPGWPEWWCRPLRDTILTAILRIGDLSVQGKDREWTHDEIDLDKVVCWEGKELKFGQIATDDEDDSNEIRLLSDLDHLRIQGSTLLAKSRDGIEQKIDLNLKLGNNDGHFDLNGHYFSMSARDCVIDGTILRGMLYKVDQRCESDQVDLRQFVRWRNDVLEFCSRPVTVQRVDAYDCDCCRYLFRYGRLHLPFNAEAIHLKPPFGSSMCPICSLLRLIVRQGKNMKSGLVECILYPTLLKSYRQAIVEVRIQPPEAADSPSVKRYAIYNRADPKISSRTFHAVPRNPLPDSWFEPDYRWPLVQGWIANCLNSHVGDCRREHWPRLPARVLDLAGAEQGLVHLAVPEGECGRYACISYRWSSLDTFTLTQANMDQLQHQGVQLRYLPRTISDVIDVCRKLGLRYLWVDSLCIQQDSKKDWQVESLKMASYYGNCHICIAATSSPDSESGWQPRERPTAIKLTGIGTDSLLFRLLAYPLEEIERYDERQHFTQISEKDIKEKYKLLKRAWVYQERRMAPRVLHLCDDEVVFECSTETVCECGHSTHYQINWTKSLPEPKLRLYGYQTPLAGAENQNDKQKPDKRWRAAAAAYSTLDLTFPPDRLPAISGFAKSMQNRKQYLGGIWEEQLLADMCWYVGPELVADDPSITQQNSIRQGERTLANISRSDIYIAPSWSWASVMEPISFLTVNSYPGATPYVTLQDTKLVPEYDDAFGALEPGSHLKLRCRLTASKWHYHEAEDIDDRGYKLRDVKGMQGQFGTFPFAGEGTNPLVRPGHPDEAFDPEELRFLPDYSITAASAKSVGADELLHVMPLQSEVAYLGTHIMKRKVEPDEVIIGPTGGQYAPSTKYVKTSALVLRRVQDDLLETENALPVYERIGFTWFFDRKPLVVESERFIQTDIILI